ncbi:hypothetical protein HDU99_010832, partial [Rhizoclosmatium hyalinum]
MLKKRHQELDVVNAELVQLSKLLSDKRDELKHREYAVAVKEANLQKAQEQMELDVENMLAKRVRARDEYLKK